MQLIVSFQYICWQKVCTASESQLSMTSITSMIKLILAVETYAPLEALDAILENKGYHSWVLMPNGTCDLEPG